MSGQPWQVAARRRRKRRQLATESTAENRAELVRTRDWRDTGAIPAFNPRDRDARRAIPAAGPVTVTRADGTSYTRPPRTNGVIDHPKGADHPT